MATSRIDIELYKNQNIIKENKNYEILQLPDYIEDQEQVNITIGKQQTKSNKNNESKITYKLDLYSGLEKYWMVLKDKVLVIPDKIHNLIIINPVIDCKIDFTKAKDLEYLEYGYCKLDARLGALSDENNESKIIQWPSNLKYLTLYNYSYPLSNLPNSLLYLRLPFTINGSLDNLPAGLLGLVFASASSCRNYTMGLNALPHGLRFLGLPAQVGCSLDNLPPNLEVLNLGADEYKQSFNCLPDSIKYLTFGNSSIPITKLPNSLIELTMFYDIVDNDSFYSRDTYDILEDMNFPEGFEKLILIDDTNIIDSAMDYAIQDLIMKKCKGQQILIEYR